VNELIEDFLQYLRHERGQAEHTQRTYKALLDKFLAWAERNSITDWRRVEFSHLTAFLQSERERSIDGSPGQKLSPESVYLEIAALKAFYRFAEQEKLLPVNLAENLSLPRRWKRLPKSLTDEEITRLLQLEPEPTPSALCDQAVLELAYASGLRLAELRNIRLEQLHLDAGYVQVVGKGNKERVTPQAKRRSRR
jgi:integrase/recombinase XerD